MEKQSHQRQTFLCSFGDRLVTLTGEKKLILVYFLEGPNIFWTETSAIQHFHCNCVKIMSSFAGSSKFTVIM